MGEPSPLPGGGGPCISFSVKCCTVSLDKVGPQWQSSCRSRLWVFRRREEAWRGVDTLVTVRVWLQRSEVQGSNAQPTIVRIRQLQA